MTGDIDSAHRAPTVRFIKRGCGSLEPTGARRGGVLEPPRGDQPAARSLRGLGAGLRNVPRSMRRISTALVTTGIVIASQAARIRGAPEMRP
jgi:hypothetical protein